MSSGLQLGPLAIPFSLLLVLVAGAVAMFVAGRLGRERAGEVESLVWQAAVVGFLVARFVFVLQFRDAYVESPLGVLDVRDGGWSPLAGFAGAALFAFVRQFRRPAIRMPLWSALATGAAIWGLGSFAATLELDDAPRLPPLALVSLEGKPVKLTDFQGRPTVVNLWATWCAPCVREMPVLQQAQAGHPAVNFVFVNAGESPQRVQGWLQSRRLPLKNVLLDPGNEVTAVFKAPGFPTTLFFDAKGRLVSVRMGELSAATLRQRLAGL